MKADAPSCTEKDLLKDQAGALGKVLFASTLMVLAFAIFNDFYGFRRLALIEVALVPVLMLIFWRLRSGAPVARMENALMGCAAVLFSALFVEGGIAHTGIYWVIGFPFVAYFIKGSAHGIRWSIGFLLWLLIWVVMDRQGFVHLDYSFSQMQLFVVIYGFYAWLAHLFKSQIELHQERMLEANRQLADESERHRLTRLRMQAILDHSPIAVCMQRDGKPLFLNRACRLWHGVNDDDASFVSDGMYDLLPPDAAERYRAEDAECLARPEQPLLRRLTIHCADGQERIVDMIRVGLRSEDGDGRSLISFGVDVTERVRAEQQEMALQVQMQHAQRLESLGMMAGGIAHDFNNVLTAIQGSAELALAECGKADGTTEHLASICEASGLAALLCQQMLAYSGKGRFVVQPLSLSDMVQDMRRLLEASVPKGVRITYDLDEALPAVDGDIAQLRQVVLNLVLNAGEAIESGEGQVDILTGSMEAADGFFDDAVTLAGKGLPAAPYIWLEVRDDGHGMDSEVVSKIFDPFFTTKEKGHGLGMSAVQGIVRSHGGGMKLDSSPGNGTAIRVYLPASTVSRPERVASVAAEVSIAATMQGTVLLADDDDVVRRVASKMLQCMGFRVVEACDGYEALATFRTSPDSFDCAVLDLTMPRMDGVSCMREMYRLRPAMPVVLSSGYDRDDDVRDGDMDAGTWQFLKKPYSFETMRAVMARSIQDAAC